MSEDRERQAIQKLIALTKAGAINWLPEKKNEALNFFATINRFTVAIYTQKGGEVAFISLVTNDERKPFYTFKDAAKEALELSVCATDSIYQTVDSFIDEVLALGLPGPQGAILTGS